MPTRKQLISNRSEAEGNTKTELIRDLIRILIIGMFFVLLTLVLKSDIIKRSFTDIQTVRESLSWLESYSSLSISTLFFILAGGLLMSLGIPRIWISALSGAVYGIFWGTCIGLLSSLLGAIILYYAGCFLLGTIVMRRFGEKLNVLKKRFQENAFWWVLYGRLFPFSNSTLSSLLCGSCKVPFSPYLAASLVGFIPLAVVFTIFGSGSMNGNYTQIYIGTGLLLIVLFIKKLIKMVSPKSNISSEKNILNVQKGEC